MTRQVAIVGGVVGVSHMPAAFVYFGGRNLHPLQRAGLVSHSGYHPEAAETRKGFDHAPHVGGVDLGYPATLRPGVALSPAVRV